MAQDNVAYRGVGVCFVEHCLECGRIVSFDVLLQGKKGRTMTALKRAAARK